jgi:AcrR family transcriptional regulator
MSDPHEERPSGAPPTRPSRREDIVAAAVRVFGRTGLADAGVQEIADEAGVVPAAVYYHFSGKDELFGLALRRVLGRIDAVVYAARPDGVPADPGALGRVIDAVWDWIEAHPDEARLFQLHLAGATGHAREVREEFERLHVRRGFAYLSDDPGGRRAEAARDLAARSLIKLTILVSTLRGEGGPMGDLPEPAVRTAVRELAQRIVDG